MGYTETPAPRRPPASAAAARPVPPQRRARQSFSKRIETSLQRLKRAELACAQQVERHDHHWHYGERGRQRNIAGSALVREYCLPDEQAGVAERPRDNKVAQRQREGKDRAGHNARKRQWQHYMPKRGARMRAQVARGFDQRLRHALEAATIGSTIYGSQTYRNARNIPIAET